ncbi:MAG: hypothetical protein IJP82_01375 [Bacteroidaceae bacterium]|nr:hypothetical protein [Bacteroidaceae bacterium]
MSFLQNPLFVPFQVLIHLMVGSPHYRGNLLRLERLTPPELLLRTEALHPAPFLYAMRHAFPNLTILLKTP